MEQERVSVEERGRRSAVRPRSSVALADRAPAGGAAAVTGGPEQLLQLQRRVGNQATVAWLGRLQPKLLVGSAFDPAERQADEIAHHVMRQLNQPAGAVDEAEAPGLQRSVLVQRALEAPVGMEGGPVSSELASTIQSERGRGHALPAPVLQPFQRAFGADLSHVRVHHDERSNELNRAVSARAFTIGSDIFLGANQYQPSTSAGKELLAHEVTHTIQQRGF